MLQKYSVLIARELGWNEKGKRQKAKRYIVNWKDIKKNMTKTDSIKKWLILLAGLQIFLTMAFLCIL